MSVIVERDIPVEMRDGVVLRGDLYRPEHGRHPSLIMRTPYDKRVPFGLMVILNPLRAAEAGYSVFIQDVRGRFSSDGDFVPLVNEALDGYDTVEWAAVQSWSTGRVGMFGSSYMAATQLQAATAAPPHLAAICPMEGSADYFEGRSYRGGAFELGALLSIALFALGVGSLQRDLSGDDFRAVWRETKAMLDDLRGTASTLPLTDLRKTVLGSHMPYFFEWMEHDEPGPFWESFSVLSGHDRIAVPALHLSSWYDTYSVGAVANYLGIRAKGATPEARENQYLWMGPWGHYMPRTVLNGAARLGEVDFGLNALVDLDVMQLAWFGRWLKDDMGAWRFKEPVRLFVMGDNKWIDAPEWPVPAETARLYLKAGPGKHGILQSSVPNSADTASYRSDPSDPVPTEGGAHLMLESVFPQGPWDQRDVEERDDILLYSSEELANDVKIVGDVSVDIWISSTAPSIDVVATLTKVQPDGKSINVLDSIRRVALTPGEATLVDVALGPVAQTFKEGERIRLRLAGSNFPRFDLNPQTGVRSIDAAERVPAVQTVFHGPDRSSALVLPLFEGTLP